MEIEERCYTVRGPLSRKYMLSVMTVLCLLLLAPGASPVEFWEDVFYGKCDDIEKELMSLAKRIVTYNKPASGPERSRNREYVWYKKWEKYGTVVCQASDKKNGKYYLYNIKTTDPKMAFVGGIHVGASVKVLEKYFEGCLNRPATERGKSYECDFNNRLNSSGTGNIGWADDDMSFEIHYKNGVITSIGWDSSIVGDKDVLIYP